METITIELTPDELQFVTTAIDHYTLGLMKHDADILELKGFKPLESAWMKLREAYHENYVRLYEKDKIS